MPAKLPCAMLPWRIELQHKPKGEMHRFGIRLESVCRDASMNGYLAVHPMGCDPLSDFRYVQYMVG